MAIYHFSAQIISRSSGKCSTAAAAYRSRDSIHDERTGVTYDYSYKGAADYCQILAPAGASSWVSDRQTLWNKVEAAERRKDSQLAREINIALPVELSKEQKIQLGLKFVRDTYVSKGIVADIAFHDLDSHNPHFHVMLTTRQLEGDGFAKTKEKAWQPEFTYYKGQKGKAQGDALDLERQTWQEYANVALMMAGIEERIDHRTLEAQGIERLPQIHLGPTVAAMEKKGISTTIGDEYRHIEQLNAELAILNVRLDITSNQIAEEQRQQQEALRQLELERQRKEQETLRQKELERQRQQQEALRQLELERQRRDEEQKHVEALKQRLREVEQKRQEEEQKRIEELKRQEEQKQSKNRYQRIKQFYENAQTALSALGKLDPKQPDTRIYVGTKYKFTCNQTSLQVFSLDGRGEILSYPYKFSFPETKAEASFTNADFDLFAKNAQMIRYDLAQQEIEKQQQQDRSRSQSKDRGFELD